MGIRNLLAGAAVAVVASAAAASANAQLINGSFETGDLSGWSAVNFGSILSHDGYFPTDGSFLAGGSAGCGANVACTLSQTFATSGGTLSGDAAFLAHDYLPYDDFGFVSLFDGSTTTNLFFADVGAVGDYGATPWTHFSTVLGAGVYTLTIGVGNGGGPFGFDDLYASHIVADNFQLTGGGVPEPAAWAMMIMGFGLAGSVVRAQRRKALA